MKQPEMTLEQFCERFNVTPKRRPWSGQDLADFCEVSLRTVEGWRQTGEGPTFFSPKGTRRVWYAERDVLAWMASGEKRSTSENVAA